MKTTRPKDMPKKMPAKGMKPMMKPDEKIMTYKKKGKERA